MLWYGMGNIGTLPRKELEDFKSLSEKQLLKNLREVNEALKKYASVNRKALDQYINFSEQRMSYVIFTIFYSVI